MYIYIIYIYIYVYRNTSKMPIAMKTELSLSTAFKNSAPRHKDVHWLHRKCHMSEHKSVQSY